MGEKEPRLQRKIVRREAGKMISVLREAGIQPGERLSIDVAGGTVSTEISPSGKRASVTKTRGQIIETARLNSGRFFPDVSFSVRADPAGPVLGSRTDLHAIHKASGVVSEASERLSELPRKLESSSRDWE